jgi:exodeoxyribonuclease V beta subunit
MTPLDALSVPLAGTNLIEASAGTGKTYTIETLYLRLLVEERRSAGEILVVTYTNAATAELRARIRRRLSAALAAFRNGGDAADETLGALVEKRRAASALEGDARWLADALASFDEAAIFTIHGFCRRVLTEHAFESGTSFDTELIADQTALIDEVVQDFWARRLYLAPGPLLQKLFGETPSQQRIGLASLAGLAAKVASHPSVPVLPERSPEIEDENPTLEVKLALVEYARRELRRRKDAANVQFFDDLLHRLHEALEGPGGKALTAKVRRRFPAALIDEFQDTDPVQYLIFREIYLGHEDAALFLIGDPKQAIYAFRGADVFAYIGAKRDAAERAHTLDTNRRSDPGLIRAVNTVFARAELPFVLGDIPFREVAARPGAEDALGGSAAASAPLEILFLPRDGIAGRGGKISKGLGNENLPRWVAAEIGRFLRSGATIGGRAVAASDIAVLCRTNKQALLMQAALRKLGVRSVLQGDASVFESPEAEDLERVVWAMARPGDAGAILAALATPILGLSAGDLVRLRENESRWDAWTESFHAWHEVWRRAGFIPAFRRLLDDSEAQARLLRLTDGERRLTNLLHLGEVLQTAARENRRGPLGLAEWLAVMRTDVRARSEVGGDAAQIRLESDEKALKLTTIHKAKGLEYPIVYCPFLWDGRLLAQEDERCLRFHDPKDGDRLKFDLGSPERGTHIEAAKREALAENLRLLYVAMTRARHRLTLVWGAFNECERSALGYVLHQPRPVPKDEDLPAAVATRLRNLGDQDIRRDLDELVRASGGTIAVRDLSFDRVEPFPRETEDESLLSCRRAERALSLTWRTASFSSLTAGGEAPSALAAEGADYDEAAGVALGAEPPRPEASVRLDQFPGGVRAGLLIHRIFELLDFGHATAEAVHALVAETLPAFGFDAVWVPVLSAAIGEVLDTPLGDGGPPALRHVSTARRLNEMEFLFPVAGEYRGDERGAFRGETLALALERHGGGALSPSYVERVRGLGFKPLAGFLKGYVDLVFEHDGRWWVVDYKSNRLGARARDYAPARLQRSMEEHHYILQYLIYVVALHRHLSRCLPGYDYERHFGGVLYVFVRGMAPGYPLGTGVFRDCPPRGLIEELSGCLASPERSLE